MAQASGSPLLPPITAQSYWKQNQPHRVSDLVLSGHCCLLNPGASPGAQSVPLSSPGWGYNSFPHLKGARDGRTWGGEEPPSGSPGSIQPAQAPGVSSCLGGCERVEAGFVDRRGDGEDPTIVLPPTAPAPANSTEPQGLRFPASPPGALHPGSLLRPLLRDTEPPLAPVWATLDGGGAVVSNAVRLGLAGLVLCLLALITGEYVLSIRNKDTPGTDSPPDAAATITTLSTIYVLQEMPIPDASEELYASLSF
ncbi:uncharacterized protein LOC123346147 isoform X3 [Mauremys mutica]|uniref:uncharacterized protein LOC123346147 isoform X3 n=1 Tax=Mauremys mutica TaxID=74926 RepID=UPI001D16CDEA|nr:uncharacterized protein LOC123346147 isoform X3 [Mauremys mutica]